MHAMSLCLSQLRSGSGQSRSCFGYCCEGERKGCDAGACSADGVESQLWERDGLFSAFVLTAGTRSPCLPSLLSAFAHCSSLDQDLN